MPSFNSVELLCALVTGCGVKLLIAVLYRPGSKAANNDFFDDLADIFERLSQFSSVVIVGDLNLHLDIAESVNAVKLISLLELNNYRQYINVATHVAGHQLEVFIARTGLPVHRVLVSPPGGLSDHSLIVANVSLRDSVSNDFINRRCRIWRSFDFDEFMDDFDKSPLATSLHDGFPPRTSVELFDLYHNTMSTLLDQHAPFKTKRISTRRSEPWFDSECRQFRRSTRRLERAYRRHRSEAVLAEWRSKFQEQRRFYRLKSEVYWSTAIAACHGDSKKLWCALNRLLQPSTTSQPLHSAADLAAHFTTKVDKVRTATSNAPPPVITMRHSTKLDDLTPVSAEEAARLIKSAPNKHCR
jgi:hypothetical protein